MTHLRALATALVVSFAAFSAEARAEDDDSILDAVRAASPGSADVIATVPSFGRYSIVAKSSEGTAIRLVDRMAGPGRLHGIPGEKDGRIDTFLEKGEYKIVPRAHQEASQDPAIVVRRFRDIGDDAPPRLVEHRPVEATLGDLEQRSYWIHLPEDGVVMLEAAGRSLADLRLLRDGRWLVDAVPEHDEVRPKPGRPMNVRRLVADLPAGLYLLRAYGGPKREWSEEPESGPSQPFHLRYGIPKLPAAGRAYHQISPLGVDRFLLPEGPRFVRLDLPEPKDASLELSPFDEQQPFRHGRARRDIDKSSVIPYAELSGPRSRTGLVVTVRGEAGSPYVLQHFAEYTSGTTLALPENGSPADHWISTLHSGHAVDQSDATALLLRRRRRSVPFGSPRPEQVAIEAVEVGPGSPWSRRFDLQGQTSVHLDVKRGGSYMFHAEPRAEFRVEPLMVTSPLHYEPPSFEPSGSEWELEAGTHVLTIRPKERGVAAVSLTHVTSAGILDGLRDRLSRREEAARTAPARSLAAARFERVRLDPADRHSIHLAGRPGVHSGVVVRRLPIDLSMALPVWLEAGETLTTPVVVAEPGTLRALREDGSLLGVSVDGAEAGDETRLERGRYTISIENESDEGVHFSIGLEPDEVSRDVPLPPLSEALLDERPMFPGLAFGETRHLDLDRGGQATFSVRADEPALYRLETTGLLDTEGNLRTPMNPSLERRSGGGRGRNFLVQRYLREGDYQVTVSTRGRSAGRLGVQLTRTEITCGGWLRDGVPAREEVPAGEGLMYRFEVEEGGTYEVESLGLGRTFRIRVEDEDGWPLVEPGRRGELTLELEPGVYRLVVLPEAVETRRVTRVSKVPSPVSFRGHGPHRLPLDVAVQHSWREPAEGEERVPDQWAFRLPAPAPVTVELSAGMEGRLLEGDEEVARVRGGTGWRGPLSAGEHRLEVWSARVDDGVDYDVAVLPKPLLSGLSREIVAPATIDVVVGEPGTVELSAFGREDVRARLVDASGTSVAASDDRPGDWSFLISRSLDAGEYRLRVDPVGASSARTKVTMSSPRKVAGEALRVPADESLRPGDGVLVHPLVIDETGLLIVSARSVETVGVALEASRGVDGPWATVANRLGRHARIEVPLQGSGSWEREGLCGEGVESAANHDDGEGPCTRYRLRLWSVDKVGNEVDLRALVVSPDPVGESALERGVRLRRTPGTDPAVAVSSIQAGRAGALIIEEPGEHERVRWSDRVDRPARPSDAGVLLRREGAAGWLIVDLDGDESARRVEARARRARAPKDGHLSSRVPMGGSAVVDIDPEPVRRGLLRRRRHVDGGIVLLSVEARGGQPAVEIVEQDDLAASAVDVTRCSLAASRAIAVSLGGGGRLARVWNASRSEAGELDARLSRLDMEPSAAAPAGHGRHGGRVDPGSTRAFDLPDGHVGLRLILDDEAVAVLSDGGEVESVHGGVGTALSERVVTGASRLTFMSASREEPARFGFEVLPSEADVEMAVALGRPLELVEETSGVVRLLVSAPGARERGPYTLRARGAVEQVTLLGGDGKVGAGDAPVPAEGGVLLVRHGSGRVFLWIDGEGEKGEGLIALDEDRGEAVVVEPPSRTRLEGRRSELLVRSGEEGPIMLHLRGGSPLASRLSGPGLEPSTNVHPEGLFEDLLLPRGRGDIVLSAIGDGVLSGTVTVATSKIVETGEGLGPDVLFGSGEARAFSFEVEEPGPVGVGARGESDDVEAWIVDSWGRVVSGNRRGFIVAMPTLRPGRYFLVLRNDRSLGPQHVRPALAGIEPLDTGPPEDVVRGYLEGTQ